MKFCDVCPMGACTIVTCDIFRKKNPASHTVYNYDYFFNQTLPKCSLRISLQKLPFGILKFNIFFFKVFYLTLRPKGKCKITNSSKMIHLIERSRVKSGTGWWWWRGTYIGYIWPCSVQGHLGALWWTWDFSRRCLQNATPHSWLFFNQRFTGDPYNSPHKSYLEF